MQLQKCSVKDVSTLALLNKQLIEDEKSDNAMNMMELEKRMKGFLETDYSAYFFMEDGEIIGYALIRNTSSPIYLRQFLIDRTYRRHHFGTQAFQLLLKSLDIKEIEIEVLPWNTSGMAFWKHCGFGETCIAMRYQELQYELVENVLRAEDFIQLKAAVGMLDRPLDQVEKALKNGLFHVSAICNGKTVGMGRLVGDGAMYWYLQDIIVLPEYQGKGIGKSIVNRLLAYIRSTAIPGTKIEVGLTSVKGKEPFYEKLGFSIGATGMRLWIDIE